MPGVLRAPHRGSPAIACDPSDGSSPAGADSQGKGNIVITALFIALVVIALAAGFILNRDDTRLRP